jgi:hypothetical protein
MKVTVELELELEDATLGLNDTELRVEIHQDLERALALAPMSMTVYGADVLEVHVENRN